MFPRERYLKELVEKKDDHLIKVITGIRRSGKSFLLNRIFVDYLKNVEGLDDAHIIRFAFDNEIDIMSLDRFLPDKPTTTEKQGQLLVNNRKFLLYIQEKTAAPGEYYLLLDEIQNLEGFVRVLNGLASRDAFHIYVTGSNSRFLSSEVDTEFGGRGEQIHLLPLSFQEYLEGSKLDKRDALEEYIQYGGIPLVQLQNSDKGKMDQASSILNETYIKDVKDRHPSVDPSRLSETLKVIASMISSPLNPSKIERTFKGAYSLNLANDTIAQYISWFEESYLLNKALRYDVKGRFYIGTPYKIYFEDVGIRNAALDFRDVDETDIIENIVYNELRYRGFHVDVGVVEVKAKTPRKDKNGNPIYQGKFAEVDFVATQNGKTYYVQVAMRIDNEQKKDQEYESIRHIPDSFKKVVVVKEQGKSFYTEEGFLRISMLDFLLNENSLDW